VNYTVAATKKEREHTRINGEWHMSKTALQKNTAVRDITVKGKIKRASGKEYVITNRQAVYKKRCKGGRLARRWGSQTCKRSPREGVSSR